MISLLRKSRIFLVLCIPLTLSNAQDQYIHFFPGSKTTGIGGSSVAISADPSAIFWNPAALPFYPCRQVTANSNEPYSFNFAAYSDFIPRFGSLGIAFSRLPAELNTLQVTSLAWGQRFTKRKAFGLNLNSMSINNEQYVTFGFGFFHQKSTSTWQLADQSNKIRQYFNDLVSKGTFSAGFMVHNIPLDYEPRLHSIRFGAFFEPHSWGPMLNMAFHLQPGDDSFHFGIGFRFIQQFRVFSGIQNWDRERLACGMEFSGSNFRSGCSFLVNQKKFNLSLIAVLGKNPGQLYDKYYNQGANFVREGNLDRSIAAYKRADAFNFDNDKIQIVIDVLENKKIQQDRTIDSLLTSALRYQHQEQYVSASLDYMNILRLSPEHKRAKENLRTIKPAVDIFVDRIFVRAISHIETREYPKAVQMLKAILVIRPNHPGAQKYLEQAETKNREKVKEHYERGLEFRRENKLERAKQEFARALEYDPSDEATQIQLDAVNATIQRITKDRAERIQNILNQANRLYRRNRAVDAFQLYHQVLEIDPDNSEARQGVERTKNRASAYARNKYTEAANAINRNDFAKAQNAFNEVIKIGSFISSLRPLHNKSIEHLRQIETKRKQECDRLYEMGMSYLNNERWDQALQQFDAILAINPNEPRALEKRRETYRNIGATDLMEKGRRYFDNGQFLDAMNVFQQVLEVQPENADAVNYITLCQASLNKQVEEHFNRGMAYYTEENYSAALNEWHKVLKINPRHADTREYINRAKERLNALNKLP
ncbi:tetratricopeptide repeat protein [candidate division KSB1 bacterium]|nr:tetratricopeptide repeat protein [candidate division KSB1 bacterium]